ncbi:MAG: MBL fold metallo-hydrolase [Weeksellaceae bacterium]|jgi:hydroxyacylglutathione hydrolase|nr:MBL fold metallo-hydrolase [Weeksellaceae bacterium]
MFFEHIYEKGLSMGSYLIGCQATKESIVIDAKRDIDTYLEIAKKNNLKITHIAETHIHADFLSGSRELAAATGAKMYLSDEGGPDWQYEFPHTGLKDGDVIKVGNLSFEVIHTPGHTPESISFLLTDHPSSEEPVMIFTGDFVFVGDVGRPDLLEKAAGISGTKEEGAKQMFEALKKFTVLPDFVQVWPAHGAGSACGKALGAVASSTVGYEKARNWALQFGDDQEEFIEALLDGQPEPPKYFAMMKKLNKVDRPLLTELPKHPKLSKNAFLDYIQKGVKIIDTRDKFTFAKGFIPGSYNIQANNSFSTWMGWCMDFDEDFVLIAEDEKMEDLTRKLMRIGLDNMKGYISDISELGIEIETADIIGIEEFKTLAQNADAQLIDVRGESEYKDCCIHGSDNLFVGTLQNNIDKINRDKQLIIYCQAGDRSSIAFSILRKNGFRNIKNYIGGMKEWNENSEPVVTKSQIAYH